MISPRRCGDRADRHSSPFVLPKVHRLAACLNFRDNLPRPVDPVCDRDTTSKESTNPMNSSTLKMGTVITFLALLFAGSIAEAADKESSDKKSNKSEAGAVKIDLTRGLVAHWEFDEKGGTVVRDKLQSEHVGKVFGVATRIDGVMNRALSFDGASGHVAVGSPPALDLSAEMSCFAWLKFQKVSTGGFGQCIYGQTHSSGRGGQYELCVGRGQNTEEVTVLWKDVDVCVSKSKLTPGKWYHIGFTRTGSPGDWTCTLYVDGAVSSVAEKITTEVDEARPFAIGRAGDYNGLYFQGDIDDLRLYNRALSPAEVAALYKLR